MYVWGIDTTYYMHNMCVSLRDRNEGAYVLCICILYLCTLLPSNIENPSDSGILGTIQQG